MSRRVAAILFAIVLGAILIWVLRPRTEQVATADPETRIITYLKENIKPGQWVFVTDLYNTVFTTPEDRETLERLTNSFFKIPATAAQMYTTTGRIPTLQELSDRFQFKVPGEMDVLLRVMEYDPRVPRFFERDPVTGEITHIDVDRIASEERFRRPLENR